MDQLHVCNINIRRLRIFRLFGSTYWYWYFSFGWYDFVIGKVGGIIGLDGLDLRIGMRERERILKK